MRRLLITWIMCLLIIPNITVSMGTFKSSCFRDPKSMVFCALHMPTNGQMVSRTPEEIDLLFLEMLKETGLDCVRVTIYPFFYEKYQNRYDTLVDNIRRENLKLLLTYSVYERKVESFDVYKEREVNLTKILIGKYKPDYYLLLNEPMTMEKRTGLNISDEQWINLVEEISQLTKKINPSTKTITTVEKSQLKLAKKFALIGNLDIVGFNLYSPKGMHQWYKGWLGKGDVVGETIEFVEKQGKDTFITETWFTLQYLYITGNVILFPVFTSPGELLSMLCG